MQNKADRNKNQLQLQDNVMSFIEHSDVYFISVPILRLIMRKQAVNKLDIRNYKSGVYLIKAKLGNTLFVDQVLVKN